MNRPLGTAGARRDAIDSGEARIRCAYTKHPKARSPSASSGSSRGTAIGGMFRASAARFRSASASARTCPHGSRATSRHPVPEDRGDPAERLHQELPLVGVRGDQLDLRVRAVREGAERVDDVRAGLDDEVLPAVRALRERGLVHDGPGLRVPAVRAPEVEAELPQALGDQEGVDGPELEGAADLVLPIRGDPSVASSPIFLKNSWTACSWSRSKRRADCPPIRCFRGTWDWTFFTGVIRFPSRRPTVASPWSITRRP